LQRFLKLFVVTVTLSVLSGFRAC